MQRLPRLASFRLSNLSSFIKENRQSIFRWPVSEFLNKDLNDMNPLDLIKNSPKSIEKKLTHLLEAARRAELKLEQLDVDGLDPDTLAEVITTINVTAIKASLCQLRKLRLILYSSPIDGDDFRKAWEHARLQIIIQSSPLLEELQIRAEDSFADSRHPISFEHTLKDSHWNRLSTLDLDYFKAEAKLFTDFLFAHKSSLVTLKLSYIVLLDTISSSWVPIFQNIAAAFRLSFAEFRGSFLGENDDEAGINMSKKVVGLDDGTITIYEALEVLLCSSYFDREIQNKNIYLKPGGDNGSRSASAEDVKARAELLLKLLGSSGSFKQVVIPSEFSSIYLTASEIFYRSIGL